jgi:hypothetical protein
MTMPFQFSKEMDISSVLDRTNWTITRASINNIAKTYNYIALLVGDVHYFSDYDDDCQRDRPNKNLKFRSFPSGCLEAPDQPR